MRAITVYRNIGTTDKFLGLDLADGCVLILVFTAAFTVNKEGLFLNGLALAGTYWGLRALKRGKPEGYLPALARYALSPRLRRVETLAGWSPAVPGFMGAIEMPGPDESDSLPPYGGA